MTREKINFQTANFREDVRCRPYFLRGPGQARLPSPPMRGDGAPSRFVLVGSFAASCEQAMADFKARWTDYFKIAVG
jgi:hypothetical protein